jgi:hypothetical protein
LKEDEMGRACSTNWEGEYIYIYIRCRWESQKERNHQENQDIDEWIILKLILEVGLGAMDWVENWYSMVV